jgi:hypothetical protein
MKAEKTKAIILINEELNGFPDLFAFFPEMLEPNGMAVSYSITGEHSSCCLEYAEASRVASAEEAAPLIERLESIGYQLDIMASLEERKGILNYVRRSICGL